MALPKLRHFQLAPGDDRLVHPNHLIYSKMEALIYRMLDDAEGVPIKTVKSFLSKIPSVFTGTDLVTWVMTHVAVSDLAEAIHLSHLLACHGYLFPIDDHVLSVKNDGTFYRFQTPYFWPSNCWEPDNTDYAVYLCKRTMQTKAHLELEDFEAENLARLQRMFSRKWEFVFMQAEAQYKVDRRRDRLERQILDSQERAFWDVHRPVPGCVNSTEVDFRKLKRSGRSAQALRQIPGCPMTKEQPTTSSASPQEPNGTGQTVVAVANATTTTTTTTAGATSPTAGGAAAVTATATVSVTTTTTTETTISVPGPSAVAAVTTSPPVVPHGAVAAVPFHYSPFDTQETLDIMFLKHTIRVLQARLDKNCLKSSRVFESYVQYYELLVQFDPFITSTDPPNPWLSDTVDFWNRDLIDGEISSRRIKLWGQSFNDMLADEQGLAKFQQFLDREYSGENLRFWREVQRLRTCSVRMVPVLVTEIYNEFLAETASSAVNVDSRVKDITENNIKNSNRYSFDEAAEHIYKLMLNDKYGRFLNSDIYQDLESRRKKDNASIKPMKWNASMKNISEKGKGKEGKMFKDVIPSFPSISKKGDGT